MAFTNETATDTTISLNCTLTPSDADLDCTPEDLRDALVGAINAAVVGVLAGHVATGQTVPCKISTSVGRDATAVFAGEA